MSDVVDAFLWSAQAGGVMAAIICGFFAGASVVAGVAYVIMLATKPLTERLKRWVR